jgi:hypothetical protein
MTHEQQIALIEEARSIRFRKPDQSQSVSVEPASCGMLFEQSAYCIVSSEPLEGYAMAHREQHGNRESKKPKKDKGSTKAQPSKWAVSEVIEAKASSKH